MSELAVFTRAELSRLSHMMKRLEERGYVVRETDPADRRCTRVTMTDAGYARLVEAAPAHAARVRDLIFDHLTRQQVSALRELTGVILAGLREHDEPESAHGAASTRTRRAG